MPSTRLDNILSAKSSNNVDTFGANDNSISEQMENLTDYDISTNQFDDTLSIGLFRLAVTPATNNTIKLTLNLEETVVGSTDYHRRINDPQGGEPLPFRIETENQLPTMDIMVNDFLSNRNKSTYLDADGIPKTKIRLVTNRTKDLTNNWTTLSAAYGGTTNTQGGLSALVDSVQTNTLPGTTNSLFALGSYADTDLSNKVIGNIPKKLDRLLDTVENTERFDIDITVDGGLSTIHSSVQTLGSKSYDDTTHIEAISGFRTTRTENTGLSDEASKYRGYWNDVITRFVTFAEFRRKDHIFIVRFTEINFCSRGKFLNFTR